MCSKILHIKTLQELDDILKNEDTSNSNFVGYAWLEYGFYPIYFNDMFSEFFSNISGSIIATCFPGQEIFYIDKVNVLIVLDDFINTRKAYLNNHETELLINNFGKFNDRGIAFWNTIRNFDEDEYDKIVYSYRFKNIIHPIGRTKAWDLGYFFKYATGEKDYYTPRDTYWAIHGTLGWNINNWKNYSFPKVFEFDNYATLFVKNSWKSRNYSSSKIDDFIVGIDGKGGVSGWGYISPELVDKIIDFFISLNRHLVIINDLSRYPIREHELIHEVSMIGHLDVTKFLSIIHNSEVFITSSTSPLDLASYYCDTNLVLLDDKQNKNAFVSNILSTKGKKSICLNNENDYSLFQEFIENIFQNKNN